MGVDEISLSNIWQVRYVTAEGEIKPGDFRDLDGVVELALKKARWQIKPSKIPDELRSCLLYTSPSPRDQRGSRMPSSA